MGKSAQFKTFFLVFKGFLPKSHWEHCVFRVFFQCFCTDSLAALLKTLRLSLFAAFSVVKWANFCKKNKKLFFSPNWQQGYTTTLAYCLICFIVLTFGISNKNSARALIEWHIMHLLRSKNTFFLNSDVTCTTKMNLHSLFAITNPKLEIQVM